MCGSVVDIQYPTAEIRRGKKEKKKEEEEEEETKGWKYRWPALLHRAAINKLEQNDTINLLGLSQILLR